MTTLQSSSSPNETTISKLQVARATAGKAGIRHKVLGVMALAMLLSTPLTAWASYGDFLSQRQDRGSHTDAIRIVMQIAREARSIIEDVNVTEAQRTAIQSAIRQTKPQAETLHQQLKGKNDLLRQQLVANPNDTARIEQLGGEIAVTQSQLARLRVQRIAAAARELTPEQRQRIAQGTSKIEDLVGDLREEFEK